MRHFEKVLVSTGLAVGALVCATTVTAVTDEEFRALQDQLNQLADAVEQQSTTETKQVHIGGYGELHYNNWEFPDGSKFRELDFHRCPRRCNGRTHLRRVRTSMNLPGSSRPAYPWPDLQLWRRRSHRYPRTHTVHESGTG